MYQGQLHQPAVVKDNRKNGLQCAKNKFYNSMNKLERPPPKPPPYKDRYVSSLHPRERPLPKPPPRNNSYPVEQQQRERPPPEPPPIRMRPEVGEIVTFDPFF